MSANNELATRHPSSGPQSRWISDVRAGAPLQAVAAIGHH
jgi:hypothetical protein